MEMIQKEMDLLLYKEFGRTSFPPNVQKEIEAMMCYIDNGDAQAMEDLAIFYEHGCEEYAIQADREKSEYWYYRAAKAGAIFSIYHFGTYLLSVSQQGALADVEKRGMEYILQSADAGFGKAQQRAGIAYMHGLGVEVSYQKAHYYLTQAIGNGCLEAQDDLEILYVKQRQ